MMIESVSNPLNSLLIEKLVANEAMAAVDPGKLFPIFNRPPKVTISIDPETDHDEALSEEGTVLSTVASSRPLSRQSSQKEACGKFCLLLSVDIDQWTFCRRN